MVQTNAVNVWSPRKKDLDLMVQIVTEQTKSGEPENAHPVQPLGFLVGLHGKLDISTGYLRYLAEEPGLAYREHLQTMEYFGGLGARYVRYGEHAADRKGILQGWDLPTLQVDLERRDKTLVLDHTVPAIKRFLAELHKSDANLARKVKAQISKAKRELEGLP